MKILNKHKDTITNKDVYIGRGSIWGNPYKIDKNNTREDVIKKYKDYLYKNKYLLAKLPELKGKNLVCFCSPLPCHGDVILECFNENFEVKDD